MNTTTPSYGDFPRELNHFIWARRSQLYKGVCLAILRSIVILPYPFFFKLIVDEFVADANITGISAIALIFIGLLSMHFYFTMEGSRILNADITAAVMEIRSRVFQKLQFLHFGYLDQQKAGRLLSKYAFDTQKIEATITPLLNQLLPNGVYALLTFVLLGFLDWRMLLLLLLLLPFYGLSRNTFFAKMMDKNHQARVAQERLTGQASEFISALRLIRGYGQEKPTTGSLEQYSDAYARSRVEQMIFNNYFNTFATVSTNVLSLVIVAGGAIMVIGGSMSIGTLFAFLSALPVIIMPIQQFTTISQQYFQGKEAYYSVRELLDSRYVEHWEGTRKIPNLRGSIKYENVTFSYHGQNTPALREINLDIAAGEHVALVGPSGSGKSTMANLILGLYNPTEGGISIDDVPQSQMNMRWLRRNCAIVMQENLLLSGTIRENLRFARANATDEEIFRAIRQANAEEFILRLPHGLETKVGERGVSLSGGQRQRLSIARALLRDPRILILDEATSALDYESERLIQEALENLAFGRTVLTIAHRLSTIKKADRIVVLDRGRIVEQGSYAELAAANGYFTSLLAAQQ
jgi:ABC-type multidrug transport system fused ATPase/permease subunit